MQVPVLLFASVAEAVGANTASVALDEPATVGTLRAALARLVPGLAGASMIAVNAEYASDDREIREGDEVAVIPPVSGG